MKKKLLKISFAMCFLFGFLKTGSSENEKAILTEKNKAEITCQEIVQKMFQAVKKISTLRYDMKAMERIDGKMIASQASIKLAVSPLKLYSKNPVTGREILWVTGENNGEAIIDPNSFPYFDLNLDPYGNLMRHNQHHTIFEIGFSYMTNTIKGFVNKSENNIDKYFQLSGSIIFSNKICYVVNINYPKFTYINYTVQKGETITSIARKLNVSEYEILQKNNFSDYNITMKEGEIIEVPSNYSSKSILYIDENTFLPLLVQIYDDKGLFEQYEYHNVEINPFISPDEFTKKYSKYHF
ncbi:MAG TPA: DUF1571 domain-containing protein [Bacteroidia bacterium]|nr:DUF1571 domain-containing protein [Bacteroidia bacterium]